MKEQINIRSWVSVSITLPVGLLRILQTSDHVPFSNLVPTGAMALFGGAYFISKRGTCLFSLLTLPVSDLVLMPTEYAAHNTSFLYDGWYVTYFAFGLMVFLGTVIIKMVSIKSVVFAGLAAGLAHFIIVGFARMAGRRSGCHHRSALHRDFAGLIQSYTPVLPFSKTW